MSKYHKGDKFVIEIDEVFENNADDFIHEEELYRIKGFNSLVFDDNGLDKLQKYETFTVRPDAWDESLKEQYNKGLEDAWKLANKIADALTTSERAEIFGYVVNGITVMDILRDFTPQEALAKLEAYEKEQEEIKVGDVVKSIIGEIEYLIITEEDDDDYEFGAINLQVMQVDRITNKGNSFKKTGKHIDISSILEQIKED